MAKAPTLRAGESVTVNYGWVKPTVGASVDAWGGYINTDLDGIDSIIHGIDTRPASTTVLGGVKVDGTTVTAAADGTISAVFVPIGDNRIINGDMRIDQRNNGASGTVAGYTVDRWSYGDTQASKGTWMRGGPDINAVTPTGFAYYLQFISSSSYTPLAADYFNFMQAIEADMISDFAFGTANAKSVTLSFWASTTAPGTYSGTLRNYVGTRSYPFTFSLPVVGFTKVIVNIPGDTGGTWVVGGNAAAMLVGFDLGSGATFRGPANGSWQNGNFIGANGAASIVATNNALLAFTGVKLEIGSVATPYNRQSLAKSMADCQRYFCWLPFSLRWVAPAVGNVLGGGLYFPAMRAAPTCGGASPDPNTGGSAAAANVTGGTFGAITPYSCLIQMTAQGSGDSYILGYRSSADAEL